MNQRKRRRPKPPAASEFRTKTLAEGEFLRLTRAGHWEFVDRLNATGAVAVVAVTPKRKLVVIEQYRIPVGQLVLDLPAGLAGDTPGEKVDDLATAARRELLEETGFEAGVLKHLATCTTSPGLTSEVVTLFLAVDLRRTGSGGGVGSEDIQVHEVPLDSINDWLAVQRKAGKLIDLKIYAALHFATQFDVP